uniref:uncharacterized protein LOC120334399 n=1 Tax=Styela clava TaxID=7725 RepID=UPI00193AD6B8|nr:uncharacterized protein LOC120334399 [Styela clava]
MSDSPIVTSPESDQDSDASSHQDEFQNHCIIHEATQKRRYPRSARCRTFSTDTNSAKTCPKSQFSWSSPSKLDKFECPKDVRISATCLKSEINDFESDEPDASGESDAESERDSQTNRKKKTGSYFIWRLFAQVVHFFTNQETENAELQADKIEDDLSPLTDEPINEFPKVQTDYDTKIEINVSNPSKEPINESPEVQTDYDIEIEELNASNPSSLNSFTDDDTFLHEKDVLEMSEEPIFLNIYEKDLRAEISKIDFYFSKKQMNHGLEVQDASMMHEINDGTNRAFTLYPDGQSRREKKKIQFENQSKSVSCLSYDDETHRSLFRAFNTLVLANLIQFCHGGFRFVSSFKNKIEKSFTKTVTTTTNELGDEKEIKTPLHSSENSSTVYGFLYFATLLMFCLPCMQNEVTHCHCDFQPKDSNKRSERKNRCSSEKNGKERNIETLPTSSKSRINRKEYVDHEKDINIIPMENEVSDQIRTQNSVHTECWMNRQKQAESGISGCNNDATAASSFNRETSTVFQSHCCQMGHLVNSNTIIHNDNIVINNFIKSEECNYEKGQENYNKDIEKKKKNILSNLYLKNKDANDSTTDNWIWEPFKHVVRPNRPSFRSTFSKKKISACNSKICGTIPNVEETEPEKEKEFGLDNEIKIEHEFRNKSTQTKVTENPKPPSPCCEVSEVTSNNKHPEKESSIAKKSQTEEEIETEPFRPNKAFENELEHWCDLLICHKEKPYQKSEAFLEDEFQFYKKKENYESQSIFEWSFKHEELSECLNTIPPEGTATFNSDDYLSRLQTFQGLRINSWYSWEEFARAGFYVIFDNTLACYSCSLQVHIEDVVSRPPTNPRWHHPGCENLQNSSYHSPSSSCGRHSPVSSQNCFSDIENDGAVSDDIRDPPGQQSIYIPPGDSRLEQYRLSTYEHYPISSPTTRKSLAKAGFYFTGFFDRVKCFSCARTVERWNDIDSPSDIRWHKNDCLFIRGHDSGNIPIKSLFNRSNAQASSSRQQEEVLQQIDQRTGNVLRTVHYPADLPERVRQTGGTFEIGPNNTIRIQTGPGLQNIGNGGNSSQPRRWRMANVISSDHRRFLTNLHLNRELDRLASFARWPVGRPSVSPAALARTGFFYLGDMDRTQCFSCGGVLRNWTLEDDAMAEHRSHFPNCKMVLGTEQRNYKVNEFPDPPADRARDYPCRFPSNPHMRNEVARQDTFDRRWPVGRTAATPAEISQAGFFFLGERDRVKCWYCNGGLQNWEYDDMPWIEHAKWFPTCQFLLQVKGQHFVYRHLTMNPHLARPIIAKQDGATVDPGNAAGTGEASRNVDIPPSGPRAQQPEPTPEIIDPQAEMRKRKERVKNIMEKSDLVKNIILMGFDEKIVAALLEDKIESGNVANPEDIYDSMSSLLDDVMKKEAEIKEEESQMQAAVQIPAVMNVGGATSMAFPSYSSVYSSMSTPMSSLGPSPGSGKYQVSLIDDNDEPMDEDMYGSVEAGPAVTQVKEVAQAVNLEENSESLQQQLDKIEEERMCKICFSNPADMVFIPCSHMICCMECTQAIRHCPVCRKKIEKAIKTYVN